MYLIFTSFFFTMLQKATLWSVNLFLIVFFYGEYQRLYINNSIRQNYIIHDISFITVVVLERYSMKQNDIMYLFSAIMKTGTSIYGPFGDKSTHAKSMNRLHWCLSKVVSCYSASTQMSTVPYVFLEQSYTYSTKRTRFFFDWKTGYEFNSAPWKSFQ